MGILFSPTADGAFASNTDNTLLNETVLTDASKDGLVVVTHGMCGINGATTTIIKCGDSPLDAVIICAEHDGHALILTCNGDTGTVIVEEPCNSGISLNGVTSFAT